MQSIKKFNYLENQMKELVYDFFSLSTKDIEKWSKDFLADFNKNYAKNFKGFIRNLL